MQDASGIKERLQQPTSSFEWDAGSGQTKSGLSEKELVQRCLDGDKESWSILVDKYKRLIFSIALRHGFSKEDADDILQDVYLSLLKNLGDLRNPQALPAWIIRTTCRECVHCHKKSSSLLLTPRIIEEHAGPANTIYDSMAHELDSEQMLGKAIAQLPTRCRELIQLLFFTIPPRSYEEVANCFGVAKGSIGFIRMKCLKRLRQRLAANGQSLGNGFALAVSLYFSAGVCLLS